MEKKYYKIVHPTSNENIVRTEVYNRVEVANNNYKLQLDIENGEDVFYISRNTGNEPYKWEGYPIKASLLFEALSRRKGNLVEVPVNL
jgi:hypothetical protein